MKAEQAFIQLSRNQHVFLHFLVAIQPEEYNWRPAPDKWSLLEILCHLRDEEREDFLPRIKIILEGSNERFKPIDPQGWVKKRKYAQKDFYKIFNDFVNMRDRSTDWLRSLEDPDWTRTYTHETLGEMSAQLFLENWVAHDLLHIRQIVNARLAYLEHFASEPLDYAGVQ